MFLFVSKESIDLVFLTKNSLEQPKNKEHYTNPKGQNLATFFTKYMGLWKDNQYDNGNYCTNQMYFLEYISGLDHPINHGRNILRKMIDQ